MLMNYRFFRYIFILFLLSGNYFVKCENVILKNDTIISINNKSAFFSSNLPIVIINTNNQDIPDEPKIDAHMTIIFNGEGKRNSTTDTEYNYDGNIGIELRGNSTQGFEKKPYNIETRDADGNNLNVEILGMPAENDWVFRASYLDRTFIRNPLAHHLSQQTGQWSSRFRHCELVLNDEYQGIYIILEKIKRDNNRVDIARLDYDELDEENITGGYIYEITGFSDDFGLNRRIRYPKLRDIHSQQLNYIKDYDDGFREIMDSPNWNDPETGYSSWIDVNSFVDEMIVQEATRNSDAYGWSAYFHKDKNGPIKAGPVWDFDQAAGNSEYKNGYETTEWLIDLWSYPAPEFWPVLFEDPVFKYKMKVKWNKLRKGSFSQNAVDNFIDSIANLLSEAQIRNFNKWNILGEQLWRDTPGWEYRTSYLDYVNYLMFYMKDRMTWMDTQIKFFPTAIEMNPQTIIYKEIETSVYPNPVKTILYLELKSLISKDINVILTDISGKIINQFTKNIIPGEHLFAIDMSNFRENIYILKVWVGKNKCSEYKIYKNH